MFSLTRKGIFYVFRIFKNHEYEERLAEEVRKFPVIYDKSHSEHKDKHVIENAWVAVTKALGLDASKSKNTKNSFSRLNIWTKEVNCEDLSDQQAQVVCRWQKRK